VRRLLQFFAVPSMLIIWPFDSSPCGAQGCPAVLVDPSQHIEGFLSKNGCTSPIDDNTYLRVLTKIMLLSRTKYDRLRLAGG
jgi:hypothetical protein